MTAALTLLVLTCYMYYKFKGAVVTYLKVKQLYKSCYAVTPLLWESHL